MPVKYDEKIKRYAKEQFFKTDKDGNHKYTNNEIADKISKQFVMSGKPPNGSTIYRWANRVKNGEKSWNDMFEDGQRSGYVDAIDIAANQITEDNMELPPEEPVEYAPQQAVLPEEQIRQQAGKILALRATTAISGYNIGQAYLRSVEAEVRKLEDAAIHDGENLEPREIEELINTKQSNGILRIINQAETILNNLNIEVVEKEKVRRDNESRKEMEKYIDVFHDIAIRKASKE
jgi:hypothetical protein